jgi:hypothetical protein
VPENNRNGLDKKFLQIYGAGRKSRKRPTLVVGKKPYGKCQFKLSQTTSLQPAIWIDVTPSPAIVGNNYSVTLPLDLTTNRFFRLHNP